MRSLLREPLPSGHQVRELWASASENQANCYSLSLLLQKQVTSSQLVLDISPKFIYLLGLPNALSVALNFWLQNPNKFYTSLTVPTHSLRTPFVLLSVK